MVCGLIDTLVRLPSAAAHFVPIIPYGHLTMTALTALPAHERPRERLFRLGVGALSDCELLALILRSGRQGEGAMELATSLLAWHGSLHALARARPEELAATSGVGPAKAAALVAALQLARRAVDHPAPIVLRNRDDVAAVAQRELDGLRRERVLVLVCDAANRLIRTVVVSDGSIDRALIPTREILNAVLRLDGRAFALAHNHPGGEPEPSEADGRATADVARAARITGLRFLGHAIVGNSTAISVTAHGTSH